MNLNRTIALVFAAFLPFAAFAKGQNRKTVVQEMVEVVKAEPVAMMIQKK